MVHVSEEQMARIKGQHPGDKLAMTPFERERVGSMFRIQLPIVDRATLRIYANLLRRLATTLDIAGTSYDKRDFDLMNIVKGHVLAVNHSARLAKSGAAGHPDDPDATQPMASLPSQK